MQPLLFMFLLFCSLQVFGRWLRRFVKDVQKAGKKVCSFLCFAYLAGSLTPAGDDGHIRPDLFAQIIFNIGKYRRECRDTVECKRS